jgi:hypothetical protein
MWMILTVMSAATAHGAIASQQCKEGVPHELYDLNIPIDRIQGEYASVWPQFKKLVDRYGGCDENFGTFSVMTVEMLDRQWLAALRFAPLRNDGGFREFIERHMDPAAETQKLDSVLGHAKTQCVAPEMNGDLCEWIAQRATAALRDARTSSAQGKQHSEAYRPIAQFDGIALHWLLIAEPILKKESIDPGNYIVEVSQRGDSILVYLGVTGRTGTVRGSPGKHPDVVVEIDKATAKVIRWNYQR